MLNLMSPTKQAKPIANKGGKRKKFYWLHACNAGFTDMCCGLKV